MPPNYNRKKKSRDPFFEDDSTKRRKVAADEDLDAEIDSGSDEDGFFDSKDEPEHVEEVENADETRKRIAKEYLKKFQESARKEKELRDEDDDEGSDEDDEGARDSLIAQRMIKEQQEESGRIRKAIASRFNFYKFY
jgi:ribosomal RNA-processing protein 9